MAACSVLLAFASSPAVHAQEPFDVLITGARVFDGTGNPWRGADVAVRGDRIVAIGALGDHPATRVIDASGLILTPGFIDTHSHAAAGLSRPGLSTALPLLTQGITTVVVNPDGGGEIDLASQAVALLADGLGVNVGQLVPHGSIRREIVGGVDRPPTAAELEQMRQLTREGMQAGGLGLSSGLFYAPGSYAVTEELIALARVVGEVGGVYQSHIRDESDYDVGVIAAVDEVVRIAWEAGVTGIVSHIKLLGPRVWGLSETLVQNLNAARAAGVAVFADQYPYEASGTGIVGALVPRWALVGGEDDLRERLSRAADRAKLRADMLENLARRGGADRLQFRRHEPDTSIEGRLLSEVAAERGVEPVDLCLELLGAGGAGLVSFNMSPEEVALLMRQPWTMTASDGGLVPLGDGVPHPRNYGTFPRKLARYALEREILSLPDAIRGMTSLPASVYGIPGRGLIAIGASADIALLDPVRLQDLATYEKPHQLSQGVEYLFVNGVLAIDAGQPTNALAGRMLRGG